MKKFVAVLMSFSLGAVLCLSNTGCPKAAEKEKSKPPPVSTTGTPPASVPKEKPPVVNGKEPGKEKENPMPKEKVDPAKEKAEPAPVKEKTEPGKGKKEPDKNGALAPRNDLLRTVAELRQQPDISDRIAFPRSQRC